MKANPDVAALVRPHSICMPEVFEMVRSTRIEYGDKPLAQEVSAKHIKKIVPPK